MATNSEISALISNTDLHNKIKAACIRAANTIRLEDSGTANHANRIIWARQCLSSMTGPTTKADQMFWMLIGANADATLATINGVSDSAINTAVLGAVDLFATGA